MWDTQNRRVHSTGQPRNLFELGVLLARLRGDEGLRAAASRLGLSRTTLSRWENTGRVPSTIEVVEPLGHRTILTARCAAGVLQLEAEAMPGLKPGDAADLFFDLPRAHLFDQATECVL